ncbi:hypothetical protein V8B55DRAFT_1518086, partial [Mucor lusitanicus]
MKMNTWKRTMMKSLCNTSKMLPMTTEMIPYYLLWLASKTTSLNKLIYHPNVILHSTTFNTKCMSICAKEPSNSVCNFEHLVLHVMSFLLSYSYFLALLLLFLLYYTYSSPRKKKLIIHLYPPKPIKF